MTKPYFYGIQGHAASWFESAEHALEMAHSLQELLGDPLLQNSEEVNAEMERLLNIAVQWELG